ncbi:hypothetical protein RHECNPAF_14110028 [Rhizobium etli CNPAF512]|nr:hypothetical protein RHECNPAF_14110028 [Rhizobium etli CNPAF512]
MEVILSIISATSCPHGGMREIAAEGWNLKSRGGCADLRSCKKQRCGGSFEASPFGLRASG